MQPHCFFCNFYHIPTYKLNLLTNLTYFHYLRTYSIYRRPPLAFSDARQTFVRLMGHERPSVAKWPVIFMGQGQG